MGTQEIRSDYSSGEAAGIGRGTVIPSRRQDVGASDLGYRFDPSAPVAYNVVEMLASGDTRSAVVTPEEHRRMAELSRAGVPVNYDGFLTNRPGSISSSPVVIVHRDTPSGTRGEKSNGLQYVEESVPLLSKIPPHVNTVNPRPVVVSPMPVLPTAPIPVLPQLGAAMVPSMPVVAVTPQVSVNPLLVAPAFSSDGKPGEKHEQDGEVPVPEEGKKRLAVIQAQETLKLVRDKVKFVGSFGKLTVPFNMVWRHDYVLSMMQYSEDGTFYEPQEVEGNLEIWWRGTVYICVPGSVYLPFPDGKVSLALFFIDEEQTTRRRAELE